MKNQIAISARIDSDIYNYAKDYATMHCTTLNRLINRAIEHYILYQQYTNTSARNMMTFGEYYMHKQRHAWRP